LFRSRAADFEVAVYGQILAITGPTGVEAVRRGCSARGGDVGFKRVLLIDAGRKGTHNYSNQ